MMGLFSRRSAQQPSNSMEEWFDAAALGLKLHFKGDVDFSEEWPNAVTGLKVRAGELWATGGAAAVEAAREYGWHRLSQEVGRGPTDLETRFMDWTAEVVGEFLQDINVPPSGYFDMDFFAEWCSQIIAHTGLDATPETHQALLERAAVVINITAADEFTKFDQNHLEPQLQVLDSLDDRANFLVAAIPSALPVLLSDFEKVSGILIEHVGQGNSLS